MPTILTRPRDAWPKPSLSKVTASGVKVNALGDKVKDRVKALDAKIKVKNVGIKAKA